MPWRTKFWSFSSKLRPSFRRRSRRCASVAARTRRFQMTSSSRPSRTSRRRPRSAKRATSYLPKALRQTSTSSTRTSNTICVRRSPTWSSCAVRSTARARRLHLRRARLLRHMQSNHRSCRQFTRLFRIVPARPLCSRKIPTCSKCPLCLEPALCLCLTCTLLTLIEAQ